MIKDISIDPAWNNRGERTIKLLVKTGNGTFFAYAPSGKSKGKWELPVFTFEQIKEALPEIKKNLIGLEEKDST